MTLPSKANALAPPAGIDSAKDRADEILRLWIIDRAELAATFPADLYGEDVWKWGRLLANLARYVAHADARARGISEAEALEAIRLNFDEEVRAPGQLSGQVRTQRET
jgi:hypothetical protein